MSDTINFLLWDSAKLNKDTGAPNPVFEFRRKAAKLLEETINSSGGIAQKKIKILFEYIPKRKVGADELAKELYQNHLENNNIMFAKGPGLLAGSYDILHTFLKKISSSTRLLFSDRPLPSNYDLPELNIINTHSNLFSDPKKSFHEKAKDLRELLDKKNTYHMSNLTDGSPILAAKESLANDGIFLFRINKDKHVDNEILEKDIKKFLSKSTEEDLISFGAMPVKIKASLFSILKNYQANRIITMAPGGDNLFDYSEITNTILMKEEANYDIYLSMENLFEKIGSNLSKAEKQVCNRTFDQLEIPMMIKYIADKEGLVFKDKEIFIKEVTQGINSINGIDDMFIGRHKDYSFEKNINVLKKSALVRVSTDNFSGTAPVKTLYKRQLNEINNQIQIASVIAFNIDVERVSNISIEEGTYSAEFYLDLISCKKDLLEFIKFNNLSSVNPKFEVRKINEECLGERYSGRYLISASFDFKSIGSNYPLDRQYIYIGISPTDDSMQIQPIPEKLIDREFVVDGWNLIDAKSGIHRQKSWIAVSDDLKRNPKTNEELRIGWQLQRSNSMTLLKIGIPLAFLYVLLYYTLYLPPEESGTALGYLTTAFLSSIALYFSTERPQPLKMTTIDVVFAFFYAISSLALLMIIFSEFFNDFYKLLIYPLRILLPLSVIGLAAFIKARLKSIKFRPSITH